MVGRLKALGTVDNGLDLCDIAVAYLNKAAHGMTRTRLHLFGCVAGVAFLSCCHTSMLMLLMLVECWPDSPAKMACLRDRFPPSHPLYLCGWVLEVHHSSVVCHNAWGAAAAPQMCVAATAPKHQRLSRW
jgi:hypothetical protein